MSKQEIVADTFPALMLELWNRFGGDMRRFDPVHTRGSFRGAITRFNGKYQLWFDINAPFGISTGLVSVDDPQKAAA